MKWWIDLLVSSARKLQRPIVTMLLVGAFIYAALSSNEEAVKVLGPPALSIVGFLFGERATRNGG